LIATARARIVISLSLDPDGVEARESEWQELHRLLTKREELS